MGGALAISIFLFTVIKTCHIPLIYGLFLLLVWLDEPLANADKSTVHETALQQVVDGLEEERPTLVGQAALPLAILFTWRQGRYVKTGYLAVSQRNVVHGVVTRSKQSLSC